MTAAWAARDEPVDGEVALRRLAARTASGSCRCDSRRPGPRSRTGRRDRSRRPRRTATRAASPPSGPTRHVGSNAIVSAPPVRSSHSSSSASSFSVTPGTIRGSSVASARSAIAQAAATRSSSARLLRRPIGLDPALDRDELDVRRRGLEPPPHRVRHEPGLDARPASHRATRRDRTMRPAGRSRRRRSATPGASRRAWISYRESASTTTSSRPTRNWPEWPATFSSPSARTKPVR